jgi:hypothetical protein
MTGRTMMALAVAAALMHGVAHASSLAELTATMGVHDAVAGPGVSSGAGSAKAARAAIERSMARSVKSDRDAPCPLKSSGNGGKAWATASSGSGKGWAKGSSSGRKSSGTGNGWASPGGSGRGSSGSGWLSASNSASGAARRR